MRMALFWNCQHNSDSATNLKFVSGERTSNQRRPARSQCSPQERAGFFMHGEETTMARIGELSTDQEAGLRDAFHVPSILVTSNDTLVPGECVSFLDASTVVAATRFSYQAIIDPFIEDSVAPGQKVWAFIRPHLVGSLTHHFDAYSIPDMPVEENEDYDECAGCY